MSTTVPILLVDDHPANLLALGAVLESEGYEIVSARSGREALAEAENREFAVVLLDVHMPDMDGFETAARMQRLSPHGRATPIIFVTAIDSPPSRILQAYERGAVDFIQKPFDADVLRAKVSVFVELHRAREEAERHSVALSQRETIDALFSEAPAAIALLRGPDFVVEFANPRVLELWGRTSSEVVGKPALLAVPQLRELGFEETFRSVLLKGERVVGDEVPIKVRRGDEEETRHLNFMHVPMRDPQGAPFGIAMFAFDVTAQVRSVRARDDLLAIVSHDLRNPLSTVLMAAKQVERFPDSNKAAGAIIRAVDRMTRLVSDLLDLSKIEAGQPLPIDIERHDISAITRQVTEQYESLATARRLTLSTNLPPPTFVLCDGERMKQAIGNLIGNAIKFTREGGQIQVGARAHEADVIVSVSDTGTGIHPDQLPHIFKPYWQADSDRKRGAGLGLSIVKTIVDAHGGRLWVDTALEKGSSFQFSVPAASRESE